MLASPLALALALAATSADPAPRDPAPAAFVDPGRLTLGATARAGLHHYGFQGGVDLLLRWHGFTLGGTWTHLGGGPGQTTGTELLGPVAGYALTLEAWRVELLGGWGRAFTKVDRLAGGFDLSSSSHFFAGQAGVDRALASGPSWCVSAGLGAWAQKVTVLGSGGSGLRTYGGGLRLGVEWGL